MITQLHRPGLWRIALKTPRGHALDDIAHVVVWPQNTAEANEPGQWLAICNPGRYKGQLSRVLLATGSRLGLIPVHFSPEFERALVSQATMCLVADTNAVYNGAIYQALRLRRGKSTTLIIPDQVQMEMQKRRERSAPELDKGTPEDFVKVARYNLPRLGSRVLSRVKDQLHYIPNHARPPEAMVRFFGSDAGDRQEEEATAQPASVGPNFQRDRLILEVVRHAPNLLPPGLPVWLITGDGNLAEQAHSEGFYVGMSWLAELPTTFPITSPHIDPRALTSQHVSWSEFSEELVWTFGFASFQVAGETKAFELRLPEARDRILLREGQPLPSYCAKEIAAKSWNPQKPASTGMVGPATIAGPSAPRKAPAAQSLIRFLLAASDGVPISKVFEPVRPYLTALEWVRAQDDRYALTDQGRGIVERWRNLTRDSVVEHCDWIRDVGKEISKLASAASVLEAANTASSGAEIATSLGWAERDVQAQIRLLSAFALLVRLDDSFATARRYSRDDAKKIVLDALRSGQGVEAYAGVVPADKLYMKLARSERLAIIEFRLAVWELFQQGLLRPSGSAHPTEKSEAVYVELLVPDQEGVPMVEKVNLSAGDFLIPKESSQAFHVLVQP